MTAVVTKHRSFFRKLGRWCAISASTLVASAALFDHFNEHVLSRNARTIVNAIRIGNMYKNTDPETPEELSLLHAKAADLILSTCLLNEGLYIKLGQGLSAVNHILPPEYTDKLKVLLDNAPSVPVSEVQRIFQEETGRKDFLDVFVEFDEVPIASASIAQVHRAKMRRSSDGAIVDVAVKVQKPKIKKQLWWDLQCYFFVCRMLQWAFELPMMWSAQCIADNLTKEIDFLVEAENCRTAKQLLARRSDVYIPIIYDEMLSKRLIVSEWIDATKFTDIAKITASYNTCEVLTTVLETFGEMVFEHGFVHCDPHPANLLIRPNQNPRNKKHFEVVILDFGLCVSESQKFRLEYGLLFKSIFTADRSTLIDIVTSWGIGNAELFASLTLQKPFTSKPIHSAQVTKSDVHQMELQMKNHVKNLLQNEALVPQELVFVGRAMNLLRALNKSYNAPVNRVNIMAHCAVKGLGHLSTFDDICDMFATDAERTAVSRPHVSRKRDRLRSLFLELQFRLTLACVAIVHQATMWYNMVLMWLLPRSWLSLLQVGNLEEQLERKEMEMIGDAKLKHNKFHQPMRIATND